MYVLRFLEPYNPTYDSLIKGDEEKEKRTKKALKSHKVNTRNFGERWSSWVTGNLRIIWDFDAEQRLTILLLAITQHSGTHREYK